MKTIYILLTIILPSMAYSLDQAIALNHCIEEGKAFGNGKGNHSINYSCYTLSKNIGPAQSKWASKDITVRSLPNILFIKYEDFVKIPKNFMDKISKFINR